MTIRARSRSKHHAKHSKQLHARARFSASVQNLLRTQFDALDSDRSGAIDAGEAALLAARFLKPNASKKEKRSLGDALRRALDVDGDGKISYEEYSNRFGPRLQMAEARGRRGLKEHPGYEKSQMAGKTIDFGISLPQEYTIVHACLFVLMFWFCVTVFLR